MLIQIEIASKKEKHQLFINTDAHLLYDFGQPIGEKVKLVSVQEGLTPELEYTPISGVKINFFKFIVQKVSVFEN